MIPAFRNLICVPAILCCCGSLFTTACTYVAGPVPVARPVARNGLIDLRTWNFESDGPIELGGEWEFYWKRLVPAQVFESADGAPPASGLIQVPMIWNDHVVPGVRRAGESHGYATYRLRILLPADGTDLGLRISDGQGSAYLAFWNGEAVARNGVVADRPGGERPEYLPQTARVAPRSADGAVVSENQIVVQISNFSHRNGGFQIPVVLGATREIFAVRDRARITDAFLAGSLLIMGLYHLGMYAYRRKDRETLWFSVMCFVITLRVLFSGERLLVEHMPWSPWLINTKAEYLSFYGGVPATALFFHSMFPLEYTRRMLRLFLALSLPACAAVLALSPALFSYTLPAIQLVIVLCGLYSLFAVARAARSRRTGAKFMLSGIVFFFATIVNDLVYYQTGAGPGFLAPLGLLGFTFTHAAVLARRTAIAFNTSEELSVDLEQKVAERTVQLAAERDRTEAALQEAESARAASDLLLSNILPRTVAEELKQRGSVAPMYFESASVLFSDFVGFTRISESMLPAELVDSLHMCFSRFDGIAARHGIEKLKTIGDAYMCAGGIPTASATHALDACLVALEFQALVREIAALKSAQNLPFWDLRIGIHSGPVTAGVIGANKFAYDVWGDTVNTASRMESSSQPGRVNISAATYRLVREFFVCEYRGTIEVKGKGGIEMYFLHGIAPEYSENGAGKLPNAAFTRRRQNLANQAGYKPA